MSSGPSFTGGILSLSHLGAYRTAHARGTRFYAAVIRLRSFVEDEETITRESFAQSEPAAMVDRAAAHVAMVASPELSEAAWTVVQSIARFAVATAAGSPDHLENATRLGLPNP
jgi:hypothetical protein